MKRMGHRGPDSQNAWEHNNISFFHLRLAIIDLAGGQQPMHLDNRYHIIYNGEIYNYKELNHKFNLELTTNSDTETILRLYQMLGRDFLKELDGMFALAIYDSEQKEIFLARDRAGEKPLYYYIRNSKFLFASELNCMRSLVDTEIDENRIANYLRYGGFYGQETAYNNILELGSGSFINISTETLEINHGQWWNIHDYYKLQKSSELSQQDYLDQVDANLNLSVERRIESSDLEVGSFLSGGIDSGLVTAIAAQKKDNLKTFTISFNGSYDEAPLAKLVADKYGTEHKEISISFENLKEDVENILTNYGEPFYDDSAIPSYYVSKVAKQELTVVLNGDGADELFGGYRRYVPYTKKDWFCSGDVTKLLSNGLYKLLPRSNEKQSKFNYLKRLLDLARKNGLENYLTATVDIFENYEDKLLADSIAHSAFAKKVNAIKDSDYTGLQKIMSLDFDFILFSNLLVKMDIATMSHSLEGRSPFLSKELLELAPQIPDQLKINGLSTKYVLRELADKYLPKILVTQPKRGFEIPLKSWVDGQLKSLVNDYLKPKNAYWRNYINPKWFTKVIDGKLGMPLEKRAKMIWCVFCLEVWYQNLD